MNLIDSHTETETETDTVQPHAHAADPVTTADDGGYDDLLPVLPPDPDDDDLCRFVHDAILDPVEDDALNWLFVDDEGRPCHPVLGMTGALDEPDRADVEQLVERMALVGSVIGASRLVLVWQYLERTTEAVRLTRRWTSLLSEMFPSRPELVAHVARTPEYHQVILRSRSRSHAPVSAGRATGGRS